MMRRGETLALVALVTLGLTHCKGKTDGVKTDAGAASPPPSAAPVPSAPATPSLAGFEGEIDLLAKSSDTAHPNQASQNVNLLVRNDKVRVDAPGGGEVAKALGGDAFLLLRVPDKKIDVVVAAKKQVIELDLNNTDKLKSLAKMAPAAAAPHGKPHPNTPPPEPPKIAKTGQKETIASFSCEDWDVTSAADHKKMASVCVGDVASNIFHFTVPDLPGEYGLFQELLDGQHFPLRVIGYDQHSGAESGRLEVTKFDPHPVDPAKFEIPADYTVVDVMQMVAGLGAGHVPGMPSGLPSVPPGVPPHHKHH
jgi:hypothetical protein